MAKKTTPVYTEHDLEQLRTFFEGQLLTAAALIYTAPDTETVEDAAVAAVDLMEALLDELANQEEDV